MTKVQHTGHYDPVLECNGQVQTLYPDDVAYLKLIEVIEDLLPAGVLNIVNGYGAEVLIGGGIDSVGASFDEGYYIQPTLLNPDSSVDRLKLL